jgi:hypothetical protein
VAKAALGGGGGNNNIPKTCLEQRAVQHTIFSRHPPIPKRYRKGSLLHCCEVVLRFEDYH